MTDIDRVLHDAKSLEPADRLRLIARLWLTMPADHWTVPTAAERAEFDRLLDDRDSDGIATASRRIAQRIQARFDPPRPTVYSVPRRFDLATIFVVTSAYAMLFGGLSALGASPIVSVVIGGFVTAVGIGQAVLFGGQRPRSASVLAGVVLHAFIWIVYWIADPRLLPTEAVLFITGYVVIGGCILGYCVGGLVGGVFLVADMFRRRLRRRQRPASQIDQVGADGS
jgi:hypothetical protein